MGSQEEMTMMERFTVGVIYMPRRLAGVFDPLGTQGDVNDIKRIRTSITQVCKQRGIADSE